MAQQYGSDPQITYNDPMAYVLYLRGRGLNPMQIDDLVRQRFGPGKTPEQRAREQQKQQEQAGWANVGGTVAGALAANEAIKGFPHITGLFGGGASTAGGAGAVTQPTLLGGADILGGGGTAGGGAGAGGVSELGATAAGSEGAASGWSLSGVGSAGNYVLPVAGTIGMADVLANQRTGRRGYLQGAASGAAMGSYFGPWGALIGAGVGLGVGAANEMLDTNRFKKEGNRLQSLLDKGVNIPEQYRGAMYLTRGRSKQQLIDIEKQKQLQGLPSNVQFAESRNEKDLKPQDIWGYAAFYEKYGNDWLNKFNEKQRLDIAQKALDAGAVQEHHGTIDIDWNKVPELKTTPTTKSRTPQSQSLRENLKKRMK